MPKISPDLLSVLRCPVTGSALTQEGDELVSTVTDENGVHLRYAIEDGIPLLLPPELLAAANAARSDQHDGPGHNPEAPAAPEASAATEAPGAPTA